MHQPTPRVELGIQLRGIASAALDVSDGLLGDLKHLLKQSYVDAEILLAELPKSTSLKKQSVVIQNQFAACGGDDYELCFTAPSKQCDAILEIGKALNLPLTKIGCTTPMQSHQTQVRIIGVDGTLLSDTDSAKLLKSFDHFSVWIKPTIQQ